jgi:hypothetical protein
MKQFVFFLFATVLLILSSACERHPASQTSPTHEEKQILPAMETEEKK